MSQRGRFGNISNVDTSGASWATANQDKLGYDGVRASQALAATDLSAVNNYRSEINQVGSSLGVDPAIIAGIMSRETRAGKVIGRNGYGFDGHGYGIMQVDDRYHKLEGGPFSREHMVQATRILVDMIRAVGSKHGSWSPEMILKGGICAYNCGPSNVRSYQNIDSASTGGDYSNDVIARAMYFRNNGF